MSPCLFNLYAEYCIQNAGQDEAQAGIKIAGRNINNFRYADDTTLEELKSFLISAQIFQEAGKTVWDSHLLKNFPQFAVIHTVKVFSVFNEAEVDFFF